MFEIEVSNLKFWQSSVDAIVNLVEEGTFTIDEKGLSLKALDPSKIAMICYTAPNSSFSSFKTEGASKIALNLDNLKKVIASDRGNEKLLIKEGDGKLVLEFTAEKSKRQFSVPLLEPEAEHREPKLKEPNSVVAILGGEFKRILRDAQLVGSHITFETKGNSLFIDAKGDDADVKINIENPVSFNVKEPSRATYPLQYLVDITKAAPDDAPVNLSFSTDLPIVIEYKIEDATLKYYLAARGED